MVKKIIEVPEGAAKIIFAPDAQDEHIDELSYMLHHQVFIEDLPDTTSKPVIKVDGELLNKFEALRNDPWIMNVWDFLTNANLDSRAMDNAARWYLGYVDLVPKEDK